MSKDLMLLMAEIMPEEMLLEQIQEKLTAYKITRSKEDKNILTMYCMLLLSKEAGEEHGFDKIKKDAEQVFAIKDRLNASKS